MNCPYCGSADPGVGNFCKNCGGQLPQSAPAPQPTQNPYQQPYSYQQPVTTPLYNTPASLEAPKQENVVLGLIGAILGSLLGIASIVLLGRIDIVASISGLILAFCTLKGYELLGKRVGTAGIVICIALMIIAPYLGDRLDWAFLVADEFYVSLPEGFAMVPQLLEEGNIESGVYYGNLALLYLFVAMGGVGSIIQAIKNNKQS